MSTKRKLSKTTLGQRLSSETVNALQSIASKFEVLPGTIVKPPIVKLDFDARKADELSSKMHAGLYDIPTSEFPIDFHQFHAIFRDTAAGPWRNSMCQKYGVKHLWAFNSVTSNYPTISIHEVIVEMNRRLFRSDYAPNMRSWKYMLAFCDDLYDTYASDPDYEVAGYYETLRKYLLMTKRFKVVRRYEKFVRSLGLRIPRYEYGIGVKLHELMLGFFKQQYLISTPCSPAKYLDRYYYPLIPNEMLNAKNRNFRVTKVILVRTKPSISVN